MAVNILGTIQVHVEDLEAHGLPPLKLFDSSIEPLSISSFFHNKRWRHLRKFTQVGPWVIKIGVECGNILC